MTASSHAGVSLGLPLKWFNFFLLINILCQSQENLLTRQGCLSIFPLFTILMEKVALQLS